MQIVGPLYGARARALAPLRNRLTQTLGGSTSWRPGGSTTPPLTHLLVMPMQSSFYAVRLGFANPYNTAVPIGSAGLYPTSTYGGADTGFALGSPSSAPVPFAPTGGAPEAQIYFDAATAAGGNAALSDQPTINVAGTNRAFTLPAVSANTGNASQPFTIWWSDFVPCTSIPRTDGGAEPLLAIAITLTSVNLTSTNINMMAFSQDTAHNRGRLLWGGHAWNRGTDFTDNLPGAGGFAAEALFPLYAIQFLTANPGIQIVQVGDSLSEAPTTDGYSTPLWRAAADLSTPSFPIAFASQAWGGTPSAVYDTQLANNASALQPSIIAHQPLSRNDGDTEAVLQSLLAKSLGLADTYGQSLGARTIWNNAGCMPSWDSDANGQAAFADLRARLSAVAAASGIPLIDAPAIISALAMNGTGNAYDYGTGVSDDNTHPNSVGAEMLVPAARAALQMLL